MLRRVKVIKKPELHSTGDHSPKCTCKGQTGTIETVHTDGIAVVRLDSGGRIGVPFGCLKELP